MIESRQSLGTMSHVKEEVNVLGSLSLILVIVILIVCTVSVDVKQH